MAQPRLSVLIPAHNEADNLPATARGLAAALERAGIDYEILVVNDHSTDDTAAVAAAIAARNPHCRVVENRDQPGYGMAVRCGLDHYAGAAVAVVMADASEDPEDVVRCCRELDTGCDCVFGSRFLRASRVSGYPFHKLVLNRLVNALIRLLFLIDFNDVTNAFKLYRREVIDGLRPLLSKHFNLTVELPLKAIIRGYSYRVVPIHWYGRKKGISKLRLREMGSRYAFIILYAWLEKMLSRGDYRRKPRPAPP